MGWQGQCAVGQGQCVVRQGQCVGGQEADINNFSALERNALNIKDSYCVILNCVTTFFSYLYFCKTKYELAVFNKKIYYVKLFMVLSFIIYHLKQLN